MTVRELMELLSAHDPDQTVAIDSYSEYGHNIDPISGSYICEYYGNLCLKAGWETKDMSPYEPPKNILSESIMCAEELITALFEFDADTPILGVHVGQYGCRALPLGTPYHHNNTGIVFLPIGRTEAMQQEWNSPDGAIILHMNMDAVDASVIPNGVEFFAETPKSENESE